MIRDNMKNIVIGIIVLVVFIGILLFAFPWLLNLGMTNLGLAWGDQIDSFFAYWNTAASNVSNWWDTTFTQPYNDASETVTDWWATYVTDPLADAADTLNAWIQTLPWMQVP